MGKETENIREEVPWLPEYSLLAGIDWQDSDSVHIRNVRNFSYKNTDTPIFGWYDCNLKLSGNAPN